MATDVSCRDLFDLASAVWGSSCLPVPKRPVIILASIFRTSGRFRLAWTASVYVYH
jgi:hypothetical protein